MKRFRILSIDGGGLRGIIPVLILKELEKRTGRKIHEMFDLIAGTSTGGLIAFGLTASNDGITPRNTLSDIENIYVNKGHEIFPQKGFFSSVVSKVTTLKRPKYKADGLNEILKSMLGDLRMSNALKPLLIPSYDVNHNEAILFKTRHAHKYTENNALLFDVCRSTSAAPTYLPAYEFNYEHKDRLCVDGGVYMNNPSVGAIVEVSRYHHEYGFPDLAFEDICCLSLGTGHYANTILKKKIQKGGGLLDWAVPITDIMMQGVNETTCYECDELLENQNFLRLSINIEDENFADMADSSAKTRNYLEQKVQTDIINNAQKMTALDAFIKHAGLSMAPVV